MKRKKLIKLLIPGIVVGLLLGFGLGMLVGVNQENPIPNYIGGALCCFIPTLLNGIIVLKGAAKVVKRKIGIGSAILRALPYALLAFAFGLFIVIVIIENLIGVSTCELTSFQTAIYQAFLGAIVSTITAYIASLKYVEDTKYKRRTEEEKQEFFNE